MSGTQDHARLLTDSLIASAIFHSRFGASILTRFKSEWIDSPEIKIIFEEAQNYYSKFRTIPTHQSLFEFIRLEGRVPKERLSQLRELSSKLPIIDPEFFEYQLEKKLQGKALHKALVDSAVFLSEGKYDEIFDLFFRARAESFVGHSRIASYWDDWDLRDSDLRGDPVPTGFVELDALMRGGLYPGEMMLTIGLKSTGKTFFAVWNARSCIFHDKTVLVFTMELPRHDFLKRLDCAIVGFEFDLYQEHKDEIKEKVLSMKDDLMGNCVVVEYPSGFPTVQIIENELLEVEQKLGRKVDLIVVDYIDLMRGTVVGGGSSPRFGLIEAAVNLRGLCGRNEVAGIVLTQSNALGKKKVFIEAENAAEAYGQTWSADFVVSINEITGRPDLRRLYVADSRRTQKKVSFLYSVDFSRSQWEAMSGF